MGENQPTYTSVSLREDNAGETSHSGVYSTAEDGNEPSVLPAEALFYALPYMGLRDVLSMEQVCKASRDWVREGVLLWRRLQVERPLSNSLTDKILIRLSKRSNRELECLCLVDCLRITERAVEQVVMTSPRLTKLFLPGCSGITAEGVVNMVREHTNRRGPEMPGLKELRLRNIPGLTERHLQSLLDIMDVAKVPCSGSKPRYYNGDYDSLSCDFHGPIDVEVCSKCSTVRMVFDCNRDTCQEKQECRACITCTVRCAECGICLKDDEQEEAVCVDYLCSNCWLRLPKCSHCNRPACSKHSSTSFEVQGSSLLCDKCADFSHVPSDLEYDL